MLSQKIREMYQKKSQTNSLTIDITVDLIFACILTAAPVRQQKKICYLKLLYFTFVACSYYFTQL